MLLDWSTIVVTAVAAGVGFVLGRWPLAAWAERSMTGARAEHRERMSRRTIRIAAAVTTAATFGAIAFRFAAGGAEGGTAAGTEDRGAVLWLLPPLFAFAAAATVLSIVDLAEQRLPNAVVFPAFAVVAVLLVPASAATGEWGSLAWAFAGSAAMFAVYFVLALISPSSMGMGDVKLALVIGLLLGWFGLSAWILGLLAAFVIGGVIAIVALALRRVTLQGSIPFGPSMLAGALVSVLFVGSIG